MSTLTLIDPTEFRGQVYAATSLDGQWEYREIGGGPVWSVTHVPTGRRYWTTGLDQGRRETADGTAADRLEIGHQPRPGKPMVQGEHTAIVAELSLVDRARMVKYARDTLPRLVGDAARRVRFRADRADVALGQILGIVYGAAPSVWVDALAAVRPDLVPPHLDRQPAAS